MSRPPRLALSCLDRRLRDLEGRAALADLEELFTMRVERDGLRAARRWYWRQAAGFLVRWRPREKEHSMNEPRSGLMNDAIRDVKWSLGTLRSHPGFALVVVLTLALGVGADTAVFSVVNAVFLQPLPYHDPDRLVRVWSAFPQDGTTRGTTSPLDLDDWTEQNSVFEVMGGFPALTLSGFVSTEGETPEEIATSFVTEGFFETMGVSALSSRERWICEGESYF